MSPSNQLRRSFEDEINERTTATTGLIVPFPDLTETKTRSSHCRRHANRPRDLHSSDSTATTSNTAPSAPISLPKSHIHRTPSELQLEQSLIQAEYTDRMMYSRLVRGMTERGAALHHARDDKGHELSRKSLMGVVECRQRPILEEGHHHDEEKDEDEPLPCNLKPGLDSGWSIGYSYEDQGSSQDVNSQGRQSANYSSQTNSSLSQEHGHIREVSAASSWCQEPQEEEDEYVFSLEM